MSSVVTSAYSFNCSRSLKISSTKSVLKKRQQQKEPSGNHPPQQPHECTVLNILTPTGLEDALSVLRELTECSAKLKMCTLPVVGMHPSEFPCLLLVFLLLNGGFIVYWRWFVFLLADEKLVAATHDTDFLTVVLEKWSNEVVWNLLCVCMPASFPTSFPASSPSSFPAQCGVTTY